MLVPKVEKNKSDRLKCHWNRGRAFARMKLDREALMDYEVAKDLDPTNEKIQCEIREIEIRMENCSDDNDDN